jgi:hypothetical protein
LSSVATASSRRVTGVSPSLRYTTGLTTFCCSVCGQGSRPADTAAVSVRTTWLVARATSTSPLPVS